MLAMGILVVVLIYFAQTFSYTVNQTYFLIFGLSLLTFMMVYINLKFSKLVSFEIINNNINIIEGNKKVGINKDDVIDYNFYLLTHKTMGYLLRINTKIKSISIGLSRLISENYRRKINNIKNLQKDISEVLITKKLKEE
jgi:hypothetical protein